MRLGGDLEAPGQRALGEAFELGAQARDVLGLVMRRGALLAAAGTAAGLALAALVTRFLHGFLAGVSPLDPVTFVGVPLVLAAIVLVASYVPARRAMRVNPLEVLRGE